jgi:DNA-binding LacI/PurR family transcriptional regulator
MPRPDLPCLTLDHGVVEGVRRSVAYLAGLGYRRIAYVGSHEDWGRFWFDGYRKGLADAGLPEDPACVVALGQQTQASGAQAATELLRRGLPCDVIMADSDMRALGLIEQLRLDGVRVPQDVGVMGYDGLENVTRQPPYLASFRKPMEQMIRAGIAVVEGLEDRATPELHETFLGQLVPGRTVRGDGSNQ